MKMRFILGGSFNPPGIHHRLIAEKLSRYCDELIVVPCGLRPDKVTTNNVEPLHRATMADMTFRGLPKVRVELFDLENDVFTPTDTLDRLFREKGFEVWHAVGADLIERGKEGKSAIEREWANGKEIWQRCNFAVITRSGFRLAKKDLPPHHRVFEINHSGMSTKIRQKVFDHESIKGLVTPEVIAYIERYGLYARISPLDMAKLNLAKPHAQIVADPENPKAAAAARKLARFSVKKNPNCIVVVGGDGFMLKVIRAYWRERLPFFGINVGHRGFLLNDLELIGARPFFSREMVVHQLPMLYVETTDTNENTRSSLAFNDAWVERTSGQTARVSVSVDDTVRLDDMWCDAALVATAQGSTAYASAMRSSPLPVGVRALVLAASNATRPLNWGPAYLPLNSRVALKALDPAKRPIRAYVDGVEQGMVAEMSVRVSRIAGAEVAFLQNYNLAEKLAQIQFNRG